MLDKEQVLITLNELPDKFSIDELMERLIFIQKVETGLAQSKSNQVLSSEIIQEKLKKWLK